MTLNESKGNMYEFVTHTWNTVKGACPHGCRYCYMKRWGEQKSARLDEKEFKTDLGTGNFIFVGSSNDLFAEVHPEEWILRTLDYCNQLDSQYLFQSKNPGRIIKFLSHPVFKKAVVCGTIETNRNYPTVVINCPEPVLRMEAMEYISQFVKTYVTVEPIMDFDMRILANWLRRCKPVQVNIGADSGNNRLPEPFSHNINNLIMELSSFTNVVIKPNLNRLLK